jgi:excisionase family DNA binding protein
MTQSDNPQASYQAPKTNPAPPKEAAAYLEISEDTVVRWFSLGTIEGFRKTPSARGRIRLYRDSVEAFDRQRKSQVPPRKQ